MRAGRYPIILQMITICCFETTGMHNIENVVGTDTSDETLYSFGRGFFPSEHKLVNLHTYRVNICS